MMKKPPDVIHISRSTTDYDLRIKNMMALLKYAFENHDAYLQKRALIGYLMIMNEQLKNL